MPATAGPTGTGRGPRGPERGGGCPGEAQEAPEQRRAPGQRFVVPDFVSKWDGSLLGTVASVHPPHPVLYGVARADGTVTYAYEDELRPATDGQRAAYEERRREWERIRGSHR